ncbi:solute carrier family 35 member F5 [Neocloeon triangulifer]|uniref:solute carrier family 35 member F5 n=1 Tax=Neocloeon triangulifer TaxID=2078957 RepID=UPI00286F397D|nr:solute carrier family 35 member F5 [Neocloeon triangulifer]XP_059488219.1 solute carrier family 35 member F5 [Neocloeon triangulifer]
MPAEPSSAIITDETSSSSTMLNSNEDFHIGLNRSQKFTLGIVLLILVDIIWVASSELTKYLYEEESYQKPLFTTYVKTSMFCVYLLGFLVYSPWRDMCIWSTASSYVLMDPNVEDSNYFADQPTALSEPSYVPLRRPDSSRSTSKSSGTESDDSSVRSVRFSKLAEVRQMSEEEATAALMARLSYSASVRADQIARRAASKLPVGKVAWLAFSFCILWCMANYSYQAALEFGEAGLVSLLSCAAPLFTLLLSAAMPSEPMDRISLSKIAAVGMSIGGASTVCWSSMNPSFPLGASLALFSAFLYAVYLVSLRKRVPSEEALDVPMFFGFVGLFCFFGLWPVVAAFHALGLEKFEWPTRPQWAVMFLNGLIGTVLSEVLWLWGCLLTCPLVGTLALTLTVPLSFLADALLWQVHYPLRVYIGAIPMVAALVWAGILSSPSPNGERATPRDPLARWILIGWTKLTSPRNSFNRLQGEREREQTESLIGVNSSSTSDHDA